MRVDRSPADVVEHLVGLQAQTPQSWYVGLWTRINGFDPVSVGLALQERRLVRLPVMRSTIHLVSGADALVLRPMTDPVIERSTLGAFGRGLSGVDRAALVAAARELTGAQPMIASELGRALAQRFPGRDPDSLAQGARAWLPMVQVPPRGVWRRSGRALQAPLEQWVGREQAAAAEPRADVADVVLRYLAAFGPASVADAQQWCGLTRLAEVFDGLRPRLVTFAGEDGRELFDLPDAPRPDAETPAPVRFLYDFDNLLLSHADRSRMLPAAAIPVYIGFAERNVQPSAVLVDGVVAATWRVTRAAGTATLTVQRISPLPEAEVAAEGTALLRLLHPGDEPEVRIEPATP